MNNYKLTQYDLDIINDKIPKIISSAKIMSEKFVEFGKSIIKLQNTLEKLNNSLGSDKNG